VHGFGSGGSCAVRAGQVERRPLDPGQPLGGPFGEPAARLDVVTARHDVEQLATADVDNLGRPQLRAELPHAARRFRGVRSCKSHLTS